jgi:hypothetical protein
MAHRTLRFSTAAGTLLLPILSHAAPIKAQAGLKTINAAQGGKILYGQVQGQTMEAGAMAAVLHSLDQSLGERPQVGKLFDVRGTDSVSDCSSCFFSAVLGSHLSGSRARFIVVGSFINQFKAHLDRH